jgi:dimethylamine monooxygenase subunit B
VTNARIDVIDVIVTDIVPISHDVKQFSFARADGGDLRKFSAGSHIVVSSKDAPQTLRNAYTLTSDPGDTRNYSIVVFRREFGKGGSKFLHDDVKVGDRLALQLPQNYFSTNKKANRHFFIAGGIGITPFITMIRDVARLGHRADLHFAARSEDLADGIRDKYLASAGDALTTYVGSRGERLDVETVIANAPLGSHVYVCGPERLVKSVLTTAERLTWPTSNIHVERFQAAASGDRFTVNVLGLATPVQVPTDRSMLDALEDSGIPVSSLCRVGVCGECMLQVVEKDGAIEHRDSVLSDLERKAGRFILPCVSRFAGCKLVVTPQ